MIANPTTRQTMESGTPAHAAQSAAPCSESPPPLTAITGRVLVVDDHAAARASITHVLHHAGHRVDCCSSAVEAVKRLRTKSYDVVITDLMMPGMSGLEFIRHIEQKRLGVQVVMVTAHATVASAVEAMRHGAFDYIEKPFGVEQIERLVERAIERGTLLDGRRTVQTASDPFHMIGSSRAMEAVRDRMDQIATTSETILISGESGTGKELVAQSIHRRSKRRAAPLVSLNCPVLSAHLLESELFGHERGAFTGADAPRIGRFELAHQGTILLDEVTEIGPGLQAKLLRVLQERTFERVGSCTPVQVDVRVLATTNRDLKEEVASGRFREDLYYRLAVLTLHLPPLRQRAEDIPELVEHFRRQSSLRLDKDPCIFDDSAHELLAAYHWPGNVRELENIVTRATVLSDGRAVSADLVRPWLIDAKGCDATVGVANAAGSVQVGLSLQEMERKLIEATLEHFGGHRAKAARALGIGIRTLSGKLRSYGYAPRTRSFARQEGTT
jgi:DNA-binding NtrC family response regulator